MVLDRAGLNHHRALTCEVPGAEPARERLATHAGQLAVEPGVHLLHRHRRPRLLRLEQACRATVDHCVYWSAQLAKEF